MRLVTILLITVIFTVDADQDYIPFSPQFQTPSQRLIATESSVYLQPESSTPTSPLAAKNNNKWPNYHLPPSEMQDNVQFSTTLPHFLSSSVFPTISRDDEEDTEDESRRTSSVHHFYKNKWNPNIKRKINITESNSENLKTQRMERTSIPQNINMQHPIDRVDKKLQNQFIMTNGATTPYTMIYTPTARNVIISADKHTDNFKPESYQNYMNVQIPKLFISSTTETAIPILRLSNEMDLDGSFSYEALGADQTHYMQHSRVENFGSDNQEQVVQGSYSYVGDNGQTYTVNYTADSNGFRASGDHLPVAPPIPEIIQRSIQYNIAQEARMPPGGKPELKETEPTKNEKVHQVKHSTKSLYTGRTPESFSLGFSGYNLNNNHMSSASTQTPTMATVDFIQDYIKDKPTPTITPQITFLASQGAHVPSYNTGEQTISRDNVMDKPTMLQLINYEAPIKGSEQEESKALWPWQYGLNAEPNQDPEKNTISRSDGQGDEIILNFNDMSPGQYADMFRSQITSNQNDSGGGTKNELYEVNNKNDYATKNHNYKFVPGSNENEYFSSTEAGVVSLPYGEGHKTSENTKIKNNNEVLNNLQPEASTTTSMTKFITKHEYLPPAQIVTKSYDYDHTLYDSKRLKTIGTDATSITEINKLTPNSSDRLNYDFWLHPSNVENISVPTTQRPHVVVSEASPFRLAHVVMSHQQNGFTPLLKNVQSDYYNEKLLVNKPTTETVADILKENVFLKNLFTKNNNVNESLLEAVINTDNHRKSDLQTGKNYVPTFEPLPPSSYHEMKSIRQPVDIANILHFLSSKNQFESSKLTPNLKHSSDYFADHYEPHIVPYQQNRYEDKSENLSFQRINNHGNHERKDEIRGVVKQYKTLQRNNKGRDTGKMRRISATVLDPNLPPMGRAGPSLESYLPSTYK